MKLTHVLQRDSRVQISLFGYRADELKRMARFWVGKEAGTYPKDKCVAAMAKALESKASVQRVLSQLSPNEQQVLAIFGRYGPMVSGPLLTAEMYARGLAQKLERPGSGGDWRAYHEARRNEPVRVLRERMILISEGYSDYFGGYGEERYPPASLNPVLAGAVAPAAPLPWRSSAPCGEVQDAYRRSGAEVALDLRRVAAALQQMGTWATVAGNSPSKQTRGRLHKEVGFRSAETDIGSPPDPECLYYELLRAMGCLDFQAASPWLRMDALDKHLRLPAVLQGWHCVRAWLGMPLWQDGVGAVPDRDSDANPVRIRPAKLQQGRELLTWALCRVAHGPREWLDLETFLRDLWHATHVSPIDLYWGSYAWNPKFEMVRRANTLPVGAERSLAFWLAGAGVWAANAVWVTLVTLGLVERGQTAGKDGRPCFRLSELGRMVFGAPEIEAAERLPETKFLTVQPNLEIVAYLDEAEPRQIGTLACFSACSSAAGGRVQTFVLKRDSVYAALESGMTLDEIRSFLAAHGRTELPANVGRILSEWAGKRESLTLRTNVTVATGCGTMETAGRALGDGTALLPAMNAKHAIAEFPGWRVCDHRGRPSPAWASDEFGRITPLAGDAVSDARLACIADRGCEGWQVTPQSIAHARALGLTPDQILDWLNQHITPPVPPLLQMAIRNWTGRETCGLARVYLLQVSRPQVRDAILHSPAFAPLLAGHIPPDWFVLRDDGIAAARKLLKTLGFALSDTLQLGPPAASREEPPPATGRRKGPRKR